MNMYYDKDAELEDIEDEHIAIIGYGIQGRAQALNMRDSGCNVIIGNIDDHYYQRAQEDGFEVTSIENAVKKASIIMVLIPDQAQEGVYKQCIQDNLDSDDMLIFAHGYSIHYSKIVPGGDIDICLMAPRMPGDPIREYYLNDGGVPAFVDVHQDSSGHAWKRLLAVSKAIGATKAGVMHISFKEETETDLFIEQFLLPLMIQGIRLAFDTLVEEGFTPEATLMELYASGEIGELFMRAANIGIYRVWQKHASPTCQFGISRSLEKVLPAESTKEKIREVIAGLRDGSFVNALSEEANSNYLSLKEYNANNENALIMLTQDKLKSIINYRSSSE